MDDEPPVILYDASCDLCRASVAFVAARDPTAGLRFAPLGSDAASALLGPLRRDGREGTDSVCLIEGGRLFERSTAALRIARRLRWPWRLAWALVVVPRPLRDLVYRLVARNRHRLAGRRLTGSR